MSTTWRSRTAWTRRSRTREQGPRSSIPRASTSTSSAACSAKAASPRISGPSRVRQHARAAARRLDAVTLAHVVQPLAPEILPLHFQQGLGALAGDVALAERVDVLLEIAEAAAQQALEHGPGADERGLAVRELREIEALQADLAELVGAEPCEHVPDVVRLADAHAQVVRPVPRRLLRIEVRAEIVR